jgi:hypothetical protein
MNGMLPLRLVIPLALLAAAGAADAQNNHYVSASIGQGVPQGESSFDPEVTFVETQWSDGVPGTTGGGREINASADTASGIMSVEGGSDNRLNGNRKSASARIDQRMRPNDDGSYGPVTVVVSLGFDGGGDPFARAYAQLEVDDCLVSVTEQVGGGSPGVVTNESNCNDNSSVDWTTSASANGLTIEADFASRPSAVYLSATVSGYFGNGTADVATGSFLATGHLAVQQIGGENPPTFTSDTFLTVPEPDHSLGFVIVTAALALLRRIRSRRST